MAGFPQFVVPKDPCNLVVRRCRLKQERADKRILIQRNGAHGDILMATPLLTALRDAWPNSHITWIVEHKEAPAIDTHPYLDELIFWDSSYWKRMLRRGLLPLWWLQGQKLKRQFREREYDIFISFQPEEWGYLVAQACGAEVRIGVFDTFRQFSGDTATSKNTRLYTRSYTFDELPLHRTDQYLLPLKALGLDVPAEKQMMMGFTNIDEAAVYRFLAEVGLKGKPFVVLAPMTTWVSRCWPGDRYAALSDALRKEGIPTVLIGSKKEQEEVEAIAAQMKYPPITAVGTMAFREMAALIAKSSLLVSGDTGPMHVAAAVGTPYLSLFGPTPVMGRAPLAGKGKVLMHPVPCGPCDKKDCPNPPDDFMLCMRHIHVNEVFESARQLVKEQELRPEAAFRE